MRLPPLNALRAFEAAARHGGYTAAAEELFVTRGAISRHVKLLEEHLEFALFRRLPHGIELTDAGRRLLPVLTGAFESIARGVRDISAERTDLRIICPPTISIRWLIPRLAQFRARYPEIRIRLTTEFFDWEEFQNGEFDLAFREEGLGQLPDGVEMLPMFPMLVTPACAPQLLNGPASLDTPEELASFTLLHEAADHHDWKSWLKAFNVKGVDPLAGDVFPNLDMAVKAAVMGSGIVMGDIVLTRDEFETGALVMPFPNLRCVTDWGRFCLFGLTSSWDAKNVLAFKAWVAEVASSDAKDLNLS